MSHAYKCLITRRGYTLRLVDDWLAYFTDSKGEWFYFVTECDPLWWDLPRKYHRYALGLQGTETARQKRDADDCIAAIGIALLCRGERPERVKEDFQADLRERYGSHK